MPADFYSLPFLWLAVLVSIWELVWKAIALWRSARNSNKGWFTFLIIFNTAGILPIIYILTHPKTENPA